MPSNTKENYLKAIYALEEAGKKIALSALSKKLKVSTPTANNMVKKLQEEGWLVYEKYKPLQFTYEGRILAASIVRKHRLAEMFLVEKMQFGWEMVHDIAEEMEHINSSDFFDRIDEMLEYPSTDPHGTPIPDKDGNTHHQKYIPLSEIAPKRKVILKALVKASKDFLVFLNKKEIELDTEITVLSREAFDGSTQVQYKDFEKVTFTKEVCERLLVAEV